MDEYTLAPDCEGSSVLSLQPVTNGSVDVRIRSRIFDPAHVEVCLLEENLIFVLPAVHMPGFVGFAERA
jgi:hypothetical protein